MPANDPVDFGYNDKICYTGLAESRGNCNEHRVDNSANLQD